jgi:hypothetical protein
MRWSRGAGRAVGRAPLGDRDLPAGTEQAGGLAEQRRHVVGFVEDERDQHAVGGGVGDQPVAAHPPAGGVLLTHRPPCPPPSRVPSPGDAFPQPLTGVTIVS